MIVSRRRLFGFGVALIAAPAIVRVSALMPVSSRWAGYSSLDEVFLAAFQREVTKVWEDVLGRDGSSRIRGGLADLVLAAPSSRVGGVDRQYIRWVPLRANWAQKVV
jgi:hypothetical protein